VRRSLVALASLACALAGGEMDSMELERRTPAQTLDAFLAVDEKYHVAPLPTHLDRRLVSARVAQELAGTLDLPRLRRVSRLAGFYDARESAGAFLRRAEPVAGVAPEPRAGALAVQTVGWIGDAEQKARASAALDALLATASPARGTREAVLAAFRAWGPGLDPARLERWLVAGSADLGAASVRARADGDATRADFLEDERDELASFARAEVGDTVAANRLRAEVGALAPGERIPRLARLYLVDSPGSSPEQSTWAAISLVRLRDADRALAAPIAAAFLELSRDFVRPGANAPARGAQAGSEPAPGGPGAASRRSAVPPGDELDADERAAREDAQRRDAEDPYGEDDPRLEADLARASCLRAAVFFGAKLGPDDADWLTGRDDPGTDLLALRPGWKYPAGH
jgi:hypothetical protein